MMYEIDTPHVHYTVDDDFIWEAQYKEGIGLITKEIAETIVADRLLYQGGKPCRLLLHGETKINMTPAARRVFSGPEGTKGIAAAVILCNNWTARLVMGFLAFIKKSGPPMAIYQDDRLAKDWLRKRSLGVPEPGVEEKSPGLRYADHFFDVSPQIQILLGKNNTISRVNPAACRRLGYTEDQLGGRPITYLTKGELNLYDRDGRAIPVRFDQSLLPAGVGGRRETLLVFRDIGAPALRELVEKAADENDNPQDRRRLKAALKAFDIQSVSQVMKDYNLKEKDLEIIRLVSIGLSTKDIALIFGNSCRTIETQKKDIYRKLGVKNGPEMIQRANELGLLL